MKSGLDINVLAKVISMSSDGNWILSNYLPVTIFAGDDSSKFSLDLMNKDIGLFLAATDELGLSVPLSATCVQTNRLARNEGYGARDYSSIISYFERPAGIELMGAGRSTSSSTR